MQNSFNIEEHYEWGKNLFGYSIYIKSPSFEYKMPTNKP